MFWDMDSLELLPRDLVFNHILNRLDFVGRVRAGAVCRAWRDLSRSAPPIACMPWICHPTYDRISAKPGGTTKAHSLVNPSASTTRHPCRRPVSFDQRFHGCRGGGPSLTLTASDPASEEKLHYTIYNPFTGDTFQLPCTVRDPAGGSRHPMKRIFGTQLSSKPPNCVVAARCVGGLYICRPGDDDWTEVLAGTECSSYVSDMIFYKGELYCIDEERIMAYDIQSIYDNKNNFSSSRRRHVLASHQSDAWSTKIDESEYNRVHYLVESGGELLVVGKYTSRILHADVKSKIRFTVHMVDQEQRRLVPMDDLGDHRMLFVGRGCSQSWPRLKMNKVVDITHEPSQFFTENCIYFFIPIVPCDPSKGPLHLGKFCLDKRPEVETRTSFELHPEYRFWVGKCWPVWITPTYPN